jgi:hypothetical protein
MADRYIPGVPCWVDTSQPDPAAAAAFYGGLFGWETEDVMPPDAPQRYLMARIRGEDVAAIGSQQPGAEGPPTWLTYVWVVDAEETARKVRDAGGSVLMEPFDVGAAGRMAVLADPAGATFAAWQAKEHRGAAVVNEHGSVNFNTLHTGDLAEAAAFYGAVFGWEVLEIGDGAMWAMAGYGDFLEERNPGMRENMAAMGAPARFEDVVAAVEVDPGAAPHWSVTFAVDDADAAARRVAELGGRVLTPPFDAPWVRMAVVADPAGATFVASQFVPPASGDASEGDVAATA